jgi:hypothetical protein
MLAFSLAGMVHFILHHYTMLIISVNCFHVRHHWTLQLLMLVSQTSLNSDYLIIFIKLGQLFANLKCLLQFCSLRDPLPSHAQ